MNLRWLVSRAVRHACGMRKHVRKVLHARSDILSPPALAALQASVQELDEAIKANGNDEALKKQIAALETTANKWLKPYPSAALRENVEVLLVALAVAMGIRTFFLQTNKIPTGSMQPTLFGITPGPQTPDAHNDPELKMPSRVSRFFDYWINGNSYFNEVASEAGELQAVKPPVHFLLFNLSQDYEFNGRWHTIWFPPDDLFKRAGYAISKSGNVLNSEPLNAGGPIVRLKVTTGDYLLVDRLSYNFRGPKRGEIVVFETKGIPEKMREHYKIPADEFYIKRLVALGGEHVQIGDDRHLIINGKRLDKDTPHFENVYGFDPSQPLGQGVYSGHVQGPYVGAPLFTNQLDGYDVKPDHYLMMGDNTMNSQDSRFWGEIPSTSVVGRYFFVYWPFSSRFGMNVR